MRINAPPVVMTMPQRLGLQLRHLGHGYYWSRSGNDYYFGCNWHDCELFMNPKLIKIYRKKK